MLNMHVNEDMECTQTRHRCTTDRDGTMSEGYVKINGQITQEEYKEVAEVVRKKITEIRHREGEEENWNQQQKTSWIRRTRKPGQKRRGRKRASRRAREADAQSVAKRQSQENTTPTSTNCQTTNISETRQRDVEDHCYAKKKKRPRRRPRRTTRRQRKQARDEMTIAYCNVQGKVSRHNNEAWFELSQLMSRSGWDIVMMTETHHQGNIQGRSIPGYALFQSQRPADTVKGGGLAVLVSKSIPAYTWVSPRAPEGALDHSNTEILWVIVPFKTTKIALGLVYLRSGAQAESWNKPLHEALAHDVGALKQEGYEPLILGDFNAHMRTVNRQTMGDDCNGRFLVKLCQDYGLRVMNFEPVCTGTWTWNRGELKSVVDYALYGDNPDVTVSSMTIDDTGHRWSIGSDHNFIEIHLTGKWRKQSISRQTERWRFTDDSPWGEYRDKLGPVLQQWTHDWDESINREEMTSETAQSAYHSLVDTVKGVAGTTFPTTNAQEGKCRASSEYCRAVKRRKAAGKHWRQALIRDRRDVLFRWHVYRRAVKTASGIRRKELMRRAVRWRQKVAESGGRSSRLIWRQFNANKEEIETVVADGKTFTTDEDILDQLYSHFSKLSTDEDDEQGSERSDLTDEPTSDESANQTGKRVVDNQTPDTTHPTVSSTTSEPAYQESRNPRQPRSGVNGVHDATNSNGPPPGLLDEFSVSEVARAIQKLKLHKACGIDGIPNELLKYGGGVLTGCITRVFKFCQQTGWTPPDWNQETLKLLHKKGRKTVLDNYRGISLTSTIGRLFTRLLNARLLRVAEEKGWLPESQAGFRWDRSTTDNLFILSAIIERAKRSHRNLFLGFVDVRKAYDSVDRDTLWLILQKLGVPSPVLNILKSLYLNTTRRILWKGQYTDPFVATKGVRQGCPLSPLLFSLYVAHIPEELDAQCNGVNMDGLKITNLWYADDLVLVAESEMDMGNALSTVWSQFLRLKLAMNYEKSLVVAVSRARQRPRTWVLQDSHGMEIGRIEDGTEYKYLGVVFGQHKYAAHLKARLTSVPFKVAQTKTWARQSLDRMVSAESLWLGSMQPALLYGAEVVLYNKTWYQRVTTAQMQVAKWIYGLSKYSSSTAVRGLIGWIPPEREVHVKRLSYWLHILEMEEGRWPLTLLRSMQAGAIQSEWYTEVVELSKKYKLSNTVLQWYGWKDRVRSTVAEAFWFEWEAEATTKAFRFFDSEMAPRSLSVQERGKSTAVRRIQIQDAVTVWGVRPGGIPEDTPCSVCGEMTRDWMIHLVKDCEVPEMDTIRDHLRLPGDGLDLDRWIRNTVNGPDGGRMRLFGELVSTWMTAAKR